MKVTFSVWHLCFLLACILLASPLSPGDLEFKEVEGLLQNNLVYNLRSPAVSSETKSSLENSTGFILILYQ